MDDNQIVYPVFEVSDVNDVTVYLNEEEIRSLELNDFEVSGAKLVDSEGCEILVGSEAQKSKTVIMRIIDFFRSDQSITIKGRGRCDVNKLKSTVLNFCKEKKIISTDDWGVLLQKIRSKNITW